jgi:hypothetical protein
LPPDLGEATSGLPAGVPGFTRQSRLIRAVLALAGLLMALDASIAAAAPAFEIGTQKKDDRVEVTASADRACFTVRSPSGIGSATITRTADRWPATVVVQLHLRGLESITLAAGKVTLAGSVASHGDQARWMSLLDGGKERPVEKGSPYWTEITTRSTDGRVPLKDGYFEIVLPPALLRHQPKTLTLRWIDFYRG